MDSLFSFQKTTTIKPRAIKVKDYAGDIYAFFEDKIFLINDHDGTTNIQLIDGTEIKTNWAFDKAYETLFEYEVPSEDTL